MRRIIESDHLSINDIGYLWKKLHLADILYFTDIFQFSENGLEQKHFQYFLMQDPLLEFTEEMDAFYQRNEALFTCFYPSASKKECENKINQLDKKIQYAKTSELLQKQKEKKNYILSLWRRGNIKNIYDLDQYLRRLTKNGILQREGDKKPFRYKTTVEYDLVFRKWAIMNGIEQWDRDRTQEIKGFDDKEFIFQGYLFGLSNTINYSEEDDKKIGFYLENIKESLCSIAEIKKTKDQELNKGNIRNVFSLDFFVHISRKE